MPWTCFYARGAVQAQREEDMASFSIDFIAHKKHHELSLWRISQGKRVIFMSSVATTFHLPPAGGGEEGGKVQGLPDSL